MPKKRVGHDPTKWQVDNVGQRRSRKPAKVTNYHGNRADNRSCAVTALAVVATVAVGVARLRGIA